MIHCSKFIDFPRFKIKFPVKAKCIYKLLYIHVWSTVDPLKIANNNFVVGFGQTYELSGTLYSNKI